MSLWATYHMTLGVLQAGVPGDLVECGVFAGVHPAVMARACEDAGQQRPIHLFDSFTGIPSPTAEDGAAGKSIEGKAACSSDAVREHLERWGVKAELVYHEGLFARTMPQANIGAIAVLRVDADLYASTQVVFDHLYPKLSCGGWCCVDDWGLAGCRQAVLEALPQEAMEPVYWQKGAKWGYEA